MTSVVQRPLVVLVAATFLAILNYAALLPVVPLWAVRGGAESLAVGTTTGGMMAATVAAQFAMPWLMRACSLRTTMVLGALLLGAPTPLYLLSDGFAAIMVLTLVRGVGFGLVVVTGGVLVADLAPAGRLASAAALYGTATSSPTVVGLAGGVWAAEHLGFGAVFWTVTGTSALACAIALALPGGRRGSFSLAGLRQARTVLTPVALLVLTGCAFGAVTTFLPLSGPPAELSAAALLVTSATLVLGRIAAGPIGDRIGSGRIQFGATIVNAAGLAVVAWSLAPPAPPAALLAGAALIGSGFGACQNDTFVETVRRLEHHGSGTASTIWNIGYDGGLGLGAFALGSIIGALGYGTAFLAMAGALAAIGLLIWLGGRLRHR